MNAKRAFYTDPESKPKVLLPCLDAVPDELRNESRWVMWRLKWMPKKNKWDKPPYQTNGRLAKSNDSTTWTTFERAAKAYRTDKFDGIGYVLGDEFPGVDLDNVRDPDTGEVIPEATELVNQFKTFADVSPSGTGIKMIGRGRWKGEWHRRSFPGRDGAEIEVLNKQYFTVTGKPFGSFPVADIQGPLDALAERFAKPMKPTAGIVELNGDSVNHEPERSFDWGDDAARIDEMFSRNGETKASSDSMSDELLLLKARNSKYGAEFSRLWSGDTADFTGDHSRADFALCRTLAFWCGGDADRIDKLFRQSGLMRGKWNEKRGETTYGKATIANALEGKTDFYSPAPKATFKATPSSNGVHEKEGNGVGVPANCERKEIILSSDIHRMADDVLQVLAERDQGIFQRAGKLVHVRKGIDPPKFLTRTAELASVELVDDDHLGVRVSRQCKFVQLKENSKGDVKIVPKQPPERLVRSVRSIPKAAVRPLTGLITSPILRPDGSILDSPGYDPQTGLYFDADLCPRIDVPHEPNDCQVSTALKFLEYPFADFPFARDYHSAAAIAATLSLVGRYTFSGCTPLFLVDSNRAGTGKGMLVDVISLIGTGTHPPSMANTDDDNEMRKRLLAIALAADQVIKIDNIGEGESLGTPALESALTSCTISDRILGRSEIVKIPLNATWFGTGNNVSLTSDMTRRVCHIRLETPLENPEERPNLREKNLLCHVREHRARYLSAVLTLLRGWFVAGMPSKDLPSWGSFEEWSSVIRQCVVWLGLPDPYQTRKELVSKADLSTSALRVLVENWDYLESPTRGLTAAQILTKLGKAEIDDNDRATQRDNIKDAIIDLCPGHGYELPSPKSLGRRLTNLSGRVIGNRRLHGEQDRQGVTYWSIRCVD